MAQDTVAALDAALRPYGLMLRGGFHPEADEVDQSDPAKHAQGEDAAPLPEGTGTLLLVGHWGAAGLMRAFDPKNATGPAPLDAWTRDILGPIAARFGARALYPFGGPPHHPFQRWAIRADRVWPSPLGLLIHARYGLWHAYRGALAFAGRLDLPAPDADSADSDSNGESPCITCVERPCLATCPVGAFAMPRNAATETKTAGQSRYDVAACAAHLGRAAGADCMALSCRARRACPVGRDYMYDPAFAGFLMRAFRRAVAPDRESQDKAGAAATLRMADVSNPQ